MISEPVTGEIVEEFPLLVSAETRYNKFRMQPGKGIAFGAVRFDSDAKSKTVELRNEGAFDITYVCCPVQSECDEIDTLDDVSYANFAIGTPPAMRKSILGEDYAERVAKGVAKGAGGKASPDKKAAKGKDVLDTNTGNMLIFDPDSYNQGVIPEDPLAIGAFTVFPRIGVITPGQRVSIDIKFDPSGCNLARERLRVCITGIDGNDSLSQLLKSFEVTGESCFPAIVDNDIHNIFEEQEQINSLNDIGGNSGDGGSESSGKFEKLPFGKVVYAETEKMLAFGPVLCGQPSAKGVCERIKISNPTKIDTKVKFRVVKTEDGVSWVADMKAKSGGGSKGAAPPAKGKDAKGKDAKGGAATEVVPIDGFTVQPESCDIPPHEFRFVNVYFNPIEIKSYKCMFIAEVDDEAGAATVTLNKPQTGKYLNFEIAGSGTMPCVAIDQPTDRTADGVLSVNFGKVHVNPSLTRKFIIRNNGVIPATCLFNMDGDSDFFFSSRDASVSVEPGAVSHLTLKFAPKPSSDSASNTEGTEKIAQVRMNVLNNQFDQYLIKLSGTSYSCDAMIDTANEDAIISSDDGDDGEDSEDALGDVVKMPSVNVSEGPGMSSQVFTIKSQSNYPVKYELSVASGGTEIPAGLLKFSPDNGHLGGKASKEITVTFAPEVAISLTDTKINCVLKRIEYKPKPDTDPDSEDNISDRSFWGTWDNSMKSVRPAVEADLEAIATYETAFAEYTEAAEAEKAKGKKGKAMGPPPDKCRIEVVGESNITGSKMVSETIAEPYQEFVDGVEPQTLSVTCLANADTVKYSCEGHGENITFSPTFMFQSTVHKFTFTNSSSIPLPVSWGLDDIKRRTTGQSRGATSQSRRPETALAVGSNVPAPFMVEPQECTVAPNSTKEFSLKFAPFDSDEYIYLLKGETLPTTPLPEGEAVPASPPQGSGPVRIIIRGTAKRPICRFDIK